MYQDDCQDEASEQDCQCLEVPNTNDPKKAVELSIVILMDQDEKSCPPPPPPPCPPPCCPPCCCPPCCMPMCCCPCPHRSPCGAAPTPPCSAPTPTCTSTGTDPCSSPCGGKNKPISICVDTRGRRDPCRSSSPGVRSTQSSTGCQTVAQQHCQTDACCLPGMGRSTGCQAESRGRQGTGCQTTKPCCQKAAVCQTGDKKCCKPKEKGEGPAPAPVCAPAKKKKRQKHKHRGTCKGPRPTTPVEQINFTDCPGPPQTFVQYFLKNECGGPLVVNLSETKLQYEKQCKMKLSKLQKHLRFKAQDFFLQVIDAINTSTPDTQHTEIKHFHVMKYIHPVLAGLHMEAVHESHTVHRYQKYILKVCKAMEDRMKAKQMVDPTCMVELETQLLAGIVARFFPFFLKIKELLLVVANKGEMNSELTPEEFSKQMRKMMLCAYVEIACIDNTFTNTLTSMSYLPNTDVQESFRQQLVLRRKHARHAIKWAARCLATLILYYYIGNIQEA